MGLSLALGVVFTLKKKKEWINKLWYMHSVAYYLTIKRKNVLIHATTWTNRENTMQSERSQLQKAAYYMISLTCCVQNGKTHKRQKLD